MLCYLAEGKLICATLTYNWWRYFQFKCDDLALVSPLGQGFFIFIGCLNMWCDLRRTRRVFRGKNAARHTKFGCWQCHHPAQLATTQNTKQSSHVVGSMGGSATISVWRWRQASRRWATPASWKREDGGSQKGCILLASFTNGKVCPPAHPPGICNDGKQAVEPFKVPGWLQGTPHTSELGHAGHHALAKWGGGHPAPAMMTCNPLCSEACLGH
jgi:hypothetical protein